MLANSGQDPVPGTRWGAGGMLANSGQDPVPGTRWGAGGGGMLANCGLVEC
jgi:hypothetical protein